MIMLPKHRADYGTDPEIPEYAGCRRSHGDFASSLSEKIEKK